MRKELLVAITLSLIFLSACATTTPTRSFSYYDTDGDGYLDSGEFYDGVYGCYDADDDDLWNTDEWDDAGHDGWLDS